MRTERAYVHGNYDIRWGNSQTLGPNALAAGQALTSGMLVDVRNDVPETFTVFLYFNLNTPAVGATTTMVVSWEVTAGVGSTNIPIGGLPNGILEFVVNPSLTEPIQSYAGIQSPFNEIFMTLELPVTSLQIRAQVANIGLSPAPQVLVAASAAPRMNLRRAGAAKT